jgi:hypothetical protein
MQWEPFYLFLNSNEMFSFSQFIRDIYNHVPEWYPSCDNALVPMIESISGPRMHKVFKLEEISEFWPWMSDRVMKNCVPIVLNSSDVNIDEEIGLKLNLELDNDARLKFLKMYASDLRFFNYEI